MFRRIFEISNDFVSMLTYVQCRLLPQWVWTIIKMRQKTFDLSTWHWRVPYSFWYEVNTFIVVFEYVSTKMHQKATSFHKTKMEKHLHKTLVKSSTLNVTKRRIVLRNCKKDVSVWKIVLRVFWHIPHRNYQHFSHIFHFLGATVF